MEGLALIQQRFDDLIEGYMDSLTRRLSFISFSAHISLGELNWVDEVLQVDIDQQDEQQGKTNEVDHVFEFRRDTASDDYFR